MKWGCCKVASMVNILKQRSDPVWLIFISHASTPYENNGKSEAEQSLAIHEVYFHISEM